MTRNNRPFHLTKDHQNFSDPLPGLSDIHALACKTITELPEKYQPFLKTILIRVENFPHPLTLQNLKLRDRYDLLGLYKGTPLPQKNHIDPNMGLDIIYLYRCPIIRYARESQESITQLVHQVIIHEIGHHFGFTEEELESFQSLENGGRNRD